MKRLDLDPDGIFSSLRARGGVFVIGSYPQQKSFSSAVCRELFLHETAQLPGQPKSPRLGFLICRRGIRGLALNPPLLLDGQWATTSIREASSPQAFLPPSDCSQCTNAAEPPRCAIASLSRKRICSASLCTLAAESSSLATCLSFSTFLALQNQIVIICPRDYACTQKNVSGNIQGNQFLGILTDLGITRTGHCRKVSAGRGSGGFK